MAWRRPTLFSVLSRFVFSLPSEHIAYHQLIDGRPHVNDATGVGFLVVGIFRHSTAEVYHEIWLDILLPPPRGWKWSHGIRAILVKNTGPWMISSQG